MSAFQDTFIAGETELEDYKPVTLNNQETCFSCDKQFQLEDHNEREGGDFCDDCLENKEGR